MVQVNLGLFPSLQRSVTSVEVAVDRTELLTEAPIADEFGTTNRKGMKQGYKYHSYDLDEAYPSLDVYYSLVDHGDFD